MQRLVRDIFIKYGLINKITDTWLRLINLQVMRGGGVLEIWDHQDGSNFYTTHCLNYSYVTPVTKFRIALAYDVGLFFGA